MNAHNIASEQLKVDEGLRLKPYHCSADKLTIGYGRNIEDKGISKREAEQMLENDIDEVVAQLGKKLCTTYIDLNEVRKSVLINMAFNLGVYGLLKFKKMIRALTIQDYKEASKQMLDSRWARQVGDRANRLSKQMETGLL